ncbi:uncharacterized protein LOC134217800 [Armigeres subalbatus]|uniref:uncharacterized protein LOC134217800 n=1 Tax=Armigeres subalbatus TaxID=124917 RepID=UPI002ED278F7
MDHFWNTLSKEVGRIPDTLKNILEVTEYINAGLAFIGNEEIAAIEDDVRLLPKIMNKSADDPSMIKFFGRFAHCPDQFRLMAGERAILKLISSCIQRKGIAHYMKTVERREKEVAVVLGSVDKVANEVRRKIVDFYTDRCDGSVEQIDFCTRVAMIPIEITEAEDGGTIAKIGCIFCTNDNVISCRPERCGGSWKVSNFLAHIRNVHKNINSPSSMQRTVGAAGTSKSSPIEMVVGENSSNGVGAYDYWTHSNDVSSSHENSFKRKLEHSGGDGLMEDYGFSIKEERYQ